MCYDIHLILILERTKIKKNNCVIKYYFFFLSNYKNKDSFSKCLVMDVIV